jgi:hypothetical protein
MSVTPKNFVEFCNESTTFISSIVDSEFSSLIVNLISQRDRMTGVEREDEVFEKMNQAIELVKEVRNIAVSDLENEEKVEDTESEEEVEDTESEEEVEDTEDEEEFEDTEDEEDDEDEEADGDDDEEEEEK